MRKRTVKVQSEKTGWAPGLLQDDDKGLSKWLSSRLDARECVRRVCREIEAKRAANALTQLKEHV